MFQTTLINLILIYPLAVLVLVGVLWLVFDWRRRRREDLLARRTLQCRVCGDPFEDNGEEELPRCPHCNALNERERVRPI